MFRPVEQCVPLKKKMSSFILISHDHLVQTKKREKKRNGNKPWPYRNARINLIMFQ